ncbi:MAG: hypothetical protein HY561_11680 [Gemmatimonadetes bacterium]|nr:hypothetical protein [Gemmatimonadota bacterium]
MIGRRSLRLLLVLTAAGSGAWTLTQRQGFPHERHAHLFPVCAGCHQEDDAGAPTYPDPQLCAACHDGAERERVAWSGPRVRPSNLRFSHGEHARLAEQAGAGVDCGGCHTSSDAGAGAVVPAAAATCLACHKAAPEHLNPASDCRACHRPLAEAPGLSTERIRAFPRPAPHDSPEFLQRHAPAPAAAIAQCAICHARESCERCHLNAPALAATTTLARDDRVRDMVEGMAAEYPRPTDHARADWRGRHGRSARADAASCANCHARTSCETCHIGPGARDAIAALPAARPGLPQGVRIARGAADAPAGGAVRARAALLHPRDFLRSHEAAAAVDQPACSGCHARSFCVDCHDGASHPDFHVANFALRHGAEAYARESDCAACHNTEVFCRACHEAAGRASRGRLDAAFHNAQPLWLLKHGQAARQGLESCTSCHAQRDCMQCHSRTGGWGVSPHGPGFDPARMAEKNQLVCARCHVGKPPRRK